MELGPPDARASALAGAAAARLLSSADRAEDRGDYGTAISLLSRCAEFSEGITRAHALTVLATALAELNDFPAAIKAAGDAVSATTDAGDERYGLRADLVRIEARGHVDPTYSLATARDEMEEVLRRLEEIGDEDGVFRALLVISRHDFYEGNCTKALSVCQRLFEPARNRSFRDRDAVAQGIGSAALFGPTHVDEALPLLDGARSLVPASLASEAGHGSARAVLLAMQGRADDVRDQRFRHAHEQQADAKD